MDIADVVAFVVSDEAGWITGDTIDDPSSGADISAGMCRRGRIR